MNWIKKLWPKKGEGTAPDVGGALAPALGQDLQNPDELINRANKRAVKGDVEGAIADFDAAIDLNPAKATAFYNRGYLQNLAGNPQQAIVDCSDAIALLPDYDEAFYQRGIAHQELGNIDAAIVDLSEVLRLNPFSIKAYYKRANCYAAQHDVQGAVADYTQAILRVPKDANAYLQRGLFLTQMQEYRTAVEDFSSALSFNPKNADAYYHRGYCYAELGEKEKATQDFNQAMLYDPNQRAADYNRDYALGILKTSKNLPPASSPPVEESKPQDEAIWVQDEEAIVLSLDSSADHQNLNVSLDETELIDPVESHLAISSPLEPSSVVEVSQPSSQGVDLDITELVSETELSPPTPPQRGTSPEPQTSGVPAQVNIDRLFELAQRQVDTGQVDAAIEIYSQIIECQPENTQAYLERGKHLRGVGKTDAAAADMEAAVYWAKQKSLDLMKDYSGSISETLSDLKQSLAKTQSQSESSSALVSGDVNQSIEGAILKHSQAIHRNPLDAQAYFERAKSRALLGDLEGAIADYTRTITLDENFRDAYYKRGLLLGALGDVEGATQDMNRAIRRNPMLSASPASPLSQPASIETTATVIPDSPQTLPQESSPSVQVPAKSSPIDQKIEDLLQEDAAPETFSSSETIEDLLQEDAALETSSSSETIEDLLQEDAVPETAMSAETFVAVEKMEHHAGPTLIDEKIEDLLHQKQPSLSVEDDIEPRVAEQVEKSSSIDDKVTNLIQSDQETIILADAPQDRESTPEVSNSQLDEKVEDDALDATLILNRPSAALVQNIQDSPPDFKNPSVVESTTNVPDEIHSMPKVWQEDQTLLLNNKESLPNPTQSDDSIPQDFNAFSRQTWVQPEEDEEGPLPTYFSDLVLEPCNHEGNNPENRFCIHCGQAISPTL